MKVNANSINLVLTVNTKNIYNGMKYKVRKAGVQYIVMNQAQLKKLANEEKRLFRLAEQAIKIHFAGREMPDMQWLMILERWQYDVKGIAHGDELRGEDSAGHYDSVIALYPIQNGYAVYDPVYEEIPCAFFMLLETYCFGNEFILRYHEKSEGRLICQMEDILAEMEERGKVYVMAKKSADELRENARLSQMLEMAAVP